MGETIVVSKEEFDRLNEELSYFKEKAKHTREVRDRNSKKYYENHNERIRNKSREKNKQNIQKYREENPEEYNKKMREYYHNNKEKILERRRIKKEQEKLNQSLSCSPP